MRAKMIAKLTRPPAEVTHGGRMSNTRWVKAIARFYLIGYVYYLISSIAMASPTLSLQTYGELATTGGYAMAQAFIAILWPLWLALGFRPWTP